MWRGDRTKIVHDGFRAYVDDIMRITAPSSLDVDVDARVRS
jgi:hypothetical protein